MNTLTDQAKIPNTTNIWNADNSFHASIKIYSRYDVDLKVYVVWTMDPTGVQQENTFRVFAHAAGRYNDAVAFYTTTSH